MSSLSVLSGAGALLRLAIAAALLGVAWRRLRRLGTVGEDAEEESTLLTLLAGLLLFLALAAWPLFYARLQSLVSETPGAICIVGVLRIGRESLGPSRWLPPLATISQVLQPLVIFLAGSWATLHLLDHRTPDARLGRPHAIAALVFAAFALFQSSAEGAYLAIPRTEDLPPQGCCVSFREAASLDVSGERLAPESVGGLVAGFLVLHAALLGLLVRDVTGRGRAGLAGLAMRGALAFGGVALSVAVLIRVLAPRLLGLPLHRCAYDLLPRLPESFVGIVLYLLGTSAVGWAILSDRVGRRADVAATGAHVRACGLVALVAYLASLALFGMELLLA